MLLTINSWTDFFRNLPVSVQQFNPQGHHNPTSNEYEYNYIYSILPNTQQIGYIAYDDQFKTWIVDRS